MIECFETVWTDVHLSFGKYKSLEHFCLILESGKWILLGVDNCFLMIEKTEDAFELHWYCPWGANIGHIRRMLDHVFTAYPVDTLLGNTPADHPMNKQARVMARAIGAERTDKYGWYALTKARFYDYNAGKIPTEG